ncbi:MAG: divalent metal cation transporter, partial [Acetobacteraceae bacterium]|nr:divalent metal cation transporter [Acetobacteraceae bacterium]
TIPERKPLAKAPEQARDAIGRIRIDTYATIALATMIGASLNFTALNPIKALFWSAVINGVVAVPVMAVMMVMSGDRKIMGAAPVSGGLRLIGWAATLCMAAAAGIMMWQIAW